MLTRKPRIAKFVADQNGAMSFLILPMFILLIVLAGISIDIYIEETHREDLQDALDRGVLAAGAPHQSLDRKQVVWSYINTRTYNDKQANADIVVREEPTFTRITAGSGYEMDTVIFSQLFTENFNIVAASEAFEGEEKVEVSLVLDISGSMSREIASGTSQKRLQVLKGAAKNFVTLMLDRPNADRVSISLVPFSGQVNAGMFFDHYVGARQWPASWAHSCMEFSTDDYGTSVMPDPLTRTQSPQFQNFYFEGDRGNNANWGWCPGAGQAILPLSNDKTALHNAIDAFVGHDGTGTNNGVKWGLGLLDPSMRGIVTTLHNTGVHTLPDELVGRPYDYGEPRAKKYLVVMTDGNIRYQNRPTSTAMNDTGSSCPEDWDAQDWGTGPKYRCYGRNYSSARNTLTRYSSQGTLNTTTKRNNDEALRVQQFLAVCNKAKEKGIRVFTIGFDISSSSDAYTEMRSCASTPGDFYHVNGADLYGAFEQILQNIAKLQLLQ